MDEIRVLHITIINDIFIPPEEFLALKIGPKKNDIFKIVTKFINVICLDKIKE